MRSTLPRHWTFIFSGGSLCLDFANTVSWRWSGRPIERLVTYEDLVSWSRQAGVVTAREAGNLFKEAQRRPRGARKALREATALREAIFRTFAAVAAGRRPRSTNLAELNAWLAITTPHQRILPAGRRFMWGWTGEPRLDRMLWPVVRSAAELLTSEDRSHIRLCAAGNCGWIFLDTTRNRSRRWCSMSVCGNRAKVRRFYQRGRASQGA